MGANDEREMDELREVVADMETLAARMQIAGDATWQVLMGYVVRIERALGDETRGPRPNEEKVL